MAGIWFDETQLYQIEHDVRHWLATPSKSHHTLSGKHKSRAIGRGLDFAELRNYQPGDDIRHIDWRASAKYGKTFSKLFEEEKERPVLLIVDQSQNMFFGSKVSFKSTQAASIASIFGWLSFCQQDKVGGLIMAANGNQAWRPLTKKNHFLHFMHGVVDANQLINSQTQCPADWNTVLNEVVALRPKSSDIYFISDFANLTEQAKQQISMLNQHNRVFALHVYDEAELQLPKAAGLALFDGLKRWSSNQLNDSYQQQMQQQHQSLRDFFTSHCYAYCAISTQDNALSILEQHRLLIR